MLVCESRQSGEIHFHYLKVIKNKTKNINTIVAMYTLYKYTLKVKYITVRKTKAQYITYHSTIQFSKITLTSFSLLAQLHTLGNKSYTREFE